ncbi:putative transcription factor FAR family [Helianthus annuus]|nr:putative transcription factor FAR family [Helianthus annuus]KAJ0573735.1 putative transcription factor FAR family [Helianthus annuus]
MEEERHNTSNFKSHLIEDIDANGYLVINNSPNVETEKITDVDVDSGFDNEEANDVMGMVFDSPDDAYDFYNRYAFLHGFGIRISSDYKNKSTNEPYRKIFVCNKEGFKNMKCNSSNGDVKKHHRDLWTGYEAYIRISKSKERKWFVDRFNDSHNHELTITPTKVMRHWSHGKFHRAMACKALVTELGQSGLKPCQIKKVVNTMKDSYENDVSSKQCADILAEQRKQYKEYVLKLGVISLKLALDCLAND